MICTFCEGDMGQVSSILGTCILWSLNGMDYVGSMGSVFTRCFLIWQIIET